MALRRVRLTYARPRGPVVLEAAIRVANSSFSVNASNSVFGHIDPRAGALPMIAVSLGGLARAPVAAIVQLVQLSSSLLHCTVTIFVKLEQLD